MQNMIYYGAQVYSNGMDGANRAFIAETTRPMPTIGAQTGVRVLGGGQTVAAACASLRAEIESACGRAATPIEERLSADQVYCLECRRPLRHGLRYTDHAGRGHQREDWS